jgi:tRNA (uracil-5-)-methyltransferase TRM9
MLIFYNRGMDAAVAQRLIALNEQFYQTLAAPFSASRGRVQPGVRRVLDGVASEADILDLGCGNGSVAEALAAQGHAGDYVGLDFSEELLAVARQKADSLKATFIKADLAGDWPLGEERFDFVFMFAALHHIPGLEQRLELLQRVHRLLLPGGRFVHSNWQFLSSPRLVERIQDWEAAGISAADLDEGDYLLDWRGGGEGLRYVHHFKEDELAELAEESGFKIEESFLSDGKEGNLAIYQTWVLAKFKE